MVNGGDGGGEFRVPPRRCGPGWNSLIDPLIEVCRQERAAILDIKSSYGGLRFYALNASRFLRDAIFAAECESFKLCEDCGATGKPRERGQWIKTQCDRCAHATDASIIR